LTPAVTYEDFLAGKAVTVPPAGFAADVTNAALFEWQRETVKWGLKQGRVALFEDTGLGKSLQSLEWAHQVVRHATAPTREGRVLLLTPLAVGPQFVREAAKFGIPDVRLVRSQDDVRDGINVANYESLHKFDVEHMDGVALDESSILKAFSGVTKQTLQRRCRPVPYRLCATATPAPNDYLELGNHAEFLGVMTSHEMIARWFISDLGEFGSYRLKGHAVESFWDWVCSWARCIGRPSDVGPYSDAGYVLPPLNVHRHTVNVDIVEGRGDALFRQVEASATAIHAERRRTSAARAEALAAKVLAEPSEAWTLWTDTDYDADALRALLPDAVEVRGSDTPERKAEVLSAFSEPGGPRVLITKPKLAGFGLNWQHCARVGFVGPSFSYEQYYQAVRRSWRFGQTRPVECHVMLAATELPVWQAVERKAADHEAMKQEMFAASRRAMARASARLSYNPTHVGRLPAWLTYQKAA
jgi:hypothetical protein